MKNLYNLIDIPTDSFIVDSLEDNSILRKHKYIFYRTAKTVFFVKIPEGLRKETTIEITEIPAENVLYYKEEGALRYEQHISGGGGMRINYAGSV